MACKQNLDSRCVLAIAIGSQHRQVRGPTKTRFEPSVKEFHPPNFILSDTNLHLVYMQPNPQTVLPPHLILVISIQLVLSALLLLAMGLPSTTFQLPFNYHAA